MQKLLIVVALSAIISGCATLTSPQSWPENLPERAYFIQSYRAYTGRSPSRAELETHLHWIKRFYHGTIIYPTGWNDMSAQLVDSLYLAEDKQVAAQRLFELGKVISVEWAKSNKVRKINSSNIGVWANSLRSSAERSEQLVFIGLVEKDVEALLTGSLKSTEISNQRYYPANEHDNF